ncbi:DMT family transporter [Sessilibacter sp. MAH4]
MKYNQALAVAALTSLTWGGTGVFVRLLPPISPFVITASRLLIAAAIVVPVLLLVKQTRTRLFASLKQPVAYVFALMFVGYYLFATTAFQLATVAEITLIMCTPPIFVLIIKWFCKEPIPRLHFVGAAVAFVGMAVMAWPQLSNLAIAKTRFVGYTFALGSAAITAFYAFFYQRLGAKGKAPESSSVSAMTFAFGALGLVIVALATGSVNSELNAEISTRTVLLMIALGLVSTAVPTLGFALSSRFLPPLITSTIPLFIPLFGATYAYFLLGETLSAAFFIGAVLIVLGVVLVMRPANSGR